MKPHGNYLIFSLFGTTSLELLFQIVGNAEEEFKAKGVWGMGRWLFIFPRLSFDNEQRFGNISHNTFRPSGPADQVMASTVWTLDWIM